MVHLPDVRFSRTDAIEEITHSDWYAGLISCTATCGNWFIEKLEIFPQNNTEFARLNLNYTVMSKRKLLQLVEEGHVEGWDDPRMPTISGLRRRGYTPASIRDFCERIGVAKRQRTCSADSW